MNLKSILIRSLSGLVYVGAIVGAIAFGYGTVSILAAIFALIAIFELENMTTQKDDENLDKTGMALDMVSVFCLIFTIVFPICFLFWLIFLIARMVWQLYSNCSSPLRAVGYSLFSQIYIGLPLFLFVVLSYLFEQNNWQLLALVAMIWINDTGAYLVGCTIGKHRLFPKHSPKKSWEGFLGGLIFNIIAGFIFGFFCFNSFFATTDSKLFLWIVAGIIVTVFATWGDLFESMIKRAVGVKDSGNIIPGHGGILDRIDSLLFVIPAVTIYFIIISLFFSTFAF